MIQGEEGTAGTMWYPLCSPGQSGGFCEPCKKGTYKISFSYGACLTCQNKPDNSYYSDTGVTTAYCPYECNSGYQSMDKNPDCLNDFDLAFNRIGQSYIAVVFFGLLLFLILLQWMCLV